MEHIWSLRKKTPGAPAPKLKGAAARLRVQKGMRLLSPPRAMFLSDRFPRDNPVTPLDISELATLSTIETRFADENDVLHLQWIVKPDEGFYKAAQFTFDVDIPHEYPIKPPKVKCQNKTYHPNIDLEGNVCLNILREDWKPVLTLNAIAFGLLYLFLEPNASDPLNKEAAEVLSQDANLFSQRVMESIERNEFVPRVSGEAVPASSVASQSGGGN